jgi:hypothetical protein
VPQTRTFAPSVSAQDLIDQAVTETGLHDFADETMRDGLERFAAMMAASGQDAPARAAGCWP